MKFELKTDDTMADGITVYILTIGDKIVNCPTVTPHYLDTKKEAWDAIKPAIITMLHRLYIDDKTAIS